MHAGAGNSSMNRLLEFRKHAYRIDVFTSYLFIYFFIIIIIVYFPKEIIRRVEKDMRRLIEILFIHLIFGKRERRSLIWTKLFLKLNLRRRRSNIRNLYNWLKW